MSKVLAHAPVVVTIGTAVAVCKVLTVYILHKHWVWLGAHLTVLGRLFGLATAVPLTVVCNTKQDGGLHN